MAGVSETSATVGGARTAACTECGERAARASLGAQIARLEREIGLAGGLRRVDRDMRGQLVADPPRTRDALVNRLADTRREAELAARRHRAARAELDRMLADPAAHRWRRLTNADLGRPGCTTYHVRPKAGPIGFLMGWWEVKISGGCPLPA